MEELEEGEITENEHDKPKQEVQGRVEKPTTPQKNVRRSNGEELEEGELISSDEETLPPPVTTKKTEKKTTQTSPNIVAQNNKEKRGVENKENRADKKKKGAHYSFSLRIIL